MLESRKPNPYGLISNPSVWQSPPPITVDSFKEITRYKFRYSVYAQFLLTEQQHLLPGLIGYRRDHGVISLDVGNGDVVKLDTTDGSATALNICSGNTTPIKPFSINKEDEHNLLQLVEYINLLERIKAIEE